MADLTFQLEPEAKYHILRPLTEKAEHWIKSHPDFSTYSREPDGSLRIPRNRYSEKAITKMIKKAGLTI
jgi:hypothetical protein